MSDRRARVHAFKAYKRNNYRWHVFLSTKGRRNGILAFDTWEEAMAAANLLTGLEHLGDETRKNARDWALVSAALDREWNKEEES